jgi:acyl-coenzyme A thioesterase PaaI-like protein
MIKKEDCKLLPNIANNMCFGCGQMNPYGLKMEFHIKDSSILSWIIVPDHLRGWEKLTHGGVLSTMLDEIMGRAAIHLLKSLCVTKSITVDFIKSVQISEKLMLEGRILHMSEDGDAITEGIIYNEKGSVCVRSTGTMALLSLQAIKRKGISNNEMIEWFERCIQVKS